MAWLDYADRDGGEFAYITHGNDIIDNSLIKQGGLSVDRYTASGSFLEFGNVSASELSLTLDNSEGWFDWAKGDVISVDIDAERSSASTPTQNNYKMGTFIIDTITKSLNTIKVVALDSMVLLDEPFDWDVQAYTITALLNRVATICGITFVQDISGLPNYNLEVLQYSCSCRELVSNIAEVMGTCAYFNADNQLTFAWYGASAITDFSEAVRVSSNVSENSYKVVDIAIGSNQDPRVELVKDGNEWKVTMRLLTSNPIVMQNSSDNTLVNNIKASCYILNASLHGMEAVTLPYPTVEPLQVFPYVDTTKSISYLVPITHRTYSLNRNMTIKSVFNPENLTISSAFTESGRAVIEGIEESVEEQKKHFFFTTDSGAHITEIANDYTDGNNVLIDSDSVDIRQGEDVIASFGMPTRIGAEGSSGVEFDELTTTFFDTNGETSAIIAQGGGAQSNKTNQFLPVNYSSNGTTATLTPSDRTILVAVPATQNLTNIQCTLRYGGQDVSTFSVPSGGASASGTIDFPTQTATPYIRSQVTVAYVKMLNVISITERKSSLTTTEYSGVFEYEVEVSYDYVETSPYFLFGKGLQPDVLTEGYGVVIGKYNAGTYAPFVIGGGANEDDRRNLFEVDYFGNVETEGSVTLVGELNMVSQGSGYKSILGVSEGGRYGNEVYLNAGGNIILGSGEWAKSFMANPFAVKLSGNTNIPYSSTGESTYIGADSAIYLVTGGQTLANSKVLAMESNGTVTFPSHLYLANNSALYGRDTGNNYKKNLELCNANNNTTLGYGNYSAEDGDTNIYGNNTSLYAKAGVFLESGIGIVEINSGGKEWVFEDTGKLTFPTGTTLAVGNSTQTAAVFIWGNVNNKIGLGVTNNDDDKRYNLLVRADSIKLYNDTDNTTVWSIIPPKVVYGGGAPANEVTSVATSTWTVLGNITLNKGGHIVSVKTRFASNSTGRRTMMLASNNTADSSGALSVSASTHSAPVAGDYTDLLIFIYVNVSADNTKYYIKGMQNSGGDLACNTRVTAIQIV